MKKSLFVCLSLIFAITFISAYSGDFSLERILDDIDQSTLILGCLFIIIFAITNLSLKRFFRNEEEKTATIISIAFSILAIYWINKQQYNFENLLYSIGISSNILFWLIPIIIFVGLICLIAKLKGLGLVIIGLLLILIAFFFAQNLMIGILGIICILIGMAIHSSAEGGNVPWDGILIITTLLILLYFFSGIILNPFFWGIVGILIILYLWFKIKKSLKNTTNTYIGNRHINIGNRHIINPILNNKNQKKSKGVDKKEKERTLKILERQRKKLNEAYVKKKTLLLKNRFPPEKERSEIIKEMEKIKYIFSKHGWKLD